QVYMPDDLADDFSYVRQTCVVQQTGKLFLGVSYSFEGAWNRRYRPPAICECDAVDRADIRQQPRLCLSARRMKLYPTRKGRVPSSGNARAQGRLHGCRIFIVGVTNDDCL